MQMIATIEQLATTLGVPQGELYYLCSRADSLYTLKQEPKKNGGIRNIHAPSRRLKFVQKKLLKKVLLNIPVPKEIGASKGSSPKLQMQHHVGKKMLMTLDISDFFPSIQHYRVTRLLTDRGFPKTVAKFISRLCTYKGSVPQGAPTSTQIARILMLPAYRRIDNLFKNIPVNITVWVDDIVISGPHSVQNKVQTIKDIVKSCGFSINDKKVHFMPDTGEQCALGIRVDHGKLKPDSEFMRKFNNARCGGAEYKSLHGMRKYRQYIMS